MSRWERTVVWLARTLLRVYPAPFRDEQESSFEEGARHRLRREAVAGSIARAWAITAVVLMADTVKAAPSAWRRHVAGHARGGQRPSRTSRLSGAAMDTRLAARALRRRPLFTGLVVMTLGLGIGASAAVFGALDRIVLRPLPYPNGDRLAYLALEYRDRGWRLAPFDEVIDRWRQRTRTLEDIETYRHLSGVLAGGGASRMVRVVGVSGGLPELLGVRALMGRIPGPPDVAEGPSLVVSERHWRGEWGSDPGVVGRTVRMNDTIFAVAGVWPESARLDYRGAPEFFRILPADEESPRGDFTLVLGLLRRGVDRALVESELTTLMEGVDDVSPDMTAVVQPPWGFLGASYVRGLWLVFWGGILLMVVAVLTATNLMLGRADSRAGEIGMRVALGASRVRLARLFVAESALLCGGGVVLAVGVARALGAGMAALEPGDIVPPGTTGLEEGAMLFAVGLAVAAALAGALVPLALARRSIAGPAAGVSGSPRTTQRRSRFRSALVAAQAALAVMLITGAALLGRSLASLRAVETGMDLDRLLIASVRLPADRYESEEARRAFFDRAAEALDALPGVEGVTTSSAPPLSFSVRGGMPWLAGEPEPTGSGSEFVAVASAPPGYFEVLGIPILEGRALTAADGRAAVVNRTFARSRSGSVLGRTLRFAGDTARWTIVGVAGDIRSNGLTDSPDRIQVYFPHSPGGGSWLRFVIRTAGDPADVLPAARAAFAALDADLPLREATTGPRILREQTATYRFVAALLLAFAALGLVFAVGGVYGTASIEVGRRIREVGLRMALGASTAHVLRRVIGTGLVPVAVGAGLGSLAVLWAAPTLEAVLFDVGARDPLSVLAGVSVLLAAGALGCVVPAFRASRVDPAVVLRAD